MAEMILMPRMSEKMSDAVLAKWNKKVGDYVKKGDLLAEVETETATMELETYKEGYILYLGAKEGETIEVDKILVIIGKKDEDIAGLLEPKHDPLISRKSPFKISSERMSDIYPQYFDGNNTRGGTTFKEQADETLKNLYYRAPIYGSEAATKSALNATAGKPVPKRSLKKETRTVEKINTITINENFDGVIGVEEESKEMADLLTNLKLETGMMVGLFGAWGRGKTFFWKKIWQNLEANSNRPFHKVEFHAWKYQDTPAAWAYLYERLSDEYLKSGNKYKLSRWLSKKYKVLKLNFQRKGFLPVLKFILISLIGTAIFLLLHQYAKVKSEEVQKIINLLGLPIIITGVIYQAGVYLKKEYSSQAKDLFSNYSQKWSFKEQLGLQAEIQKETLQLLKSWIPGKRIGKQRVLIFVDDIDRCNENKIIEIIDSLRVMLDDTEIAQRVVVVAAIDERVLKMSIANKYYELVSKLNDQNVDERNSSMDRMTREYMDKIFIAGIKLKSLNADERQEILNTITKGKVHFQETSEIKDIQPGHPNTGVGVKKLPADPDIAQDVEFKSWDGDHELEDFELALLSDLLKNDMNATPRNIRILYYRYLLAKRFMRYSFPEGSSLFYDWNNKTDKAILPYMLYNYGSLTSPETIQKDYGTVEKSNDRVISMPIFDKDFIAPKEIVLELLKIVDTVVPY